MLRLPIMTLFIFLILVFLSTQRQSFALRKSSHAPKIDFLGTLLSRFFEDQGATSSIYVLLYLFVVNPTYHSQNCENLL